MADGNPLAFQLEGDPSLLARMMEDKAGAHEFYRPTNYWAHYDAYFLSKGNYPA